MLKILDLFIDKLSIIIDIANCFSRQNSKFKNSDKNSNRILFGKVDGSYLLSRYVTI